MFYKAGNWYSIFPDEDMYGDECSIHRPVCGIDTIIKIPDFYIVVFRKVAFTN